MIPYHNQLTHLILTLLCFALQKHKSMIACGAGSTTNETFLFDSCHITAITLITIVDSCSKPSSLLEIRTNHPPLEIFHANFGSS